MFKLESERLKREFKITNGNFYASQILNKITDMCFVPDGNGSEFTVFFEDGSEFSSKGLPVLFSSQENDKLKFVFAEYCGVTVTVEYWVHGDGCTVCKQLTVSQNDDRVIDRIFLEDIGIINSKTNFSVDAKTHSEGENFMYSLGQPFYIDSLFFGCESPAVDSKIIHGSGQIRYYVGKNVGKDFKCPVTVMGGGRDNTMLAMQEAFYEYLQFISTENAPYIQFVSTYGGKKTSAADLAAYAGEAVQAATAPILPPLNAFVEGTGVWESSKTAFPSFGKRFESGFAEIKDACGDAGPGVRLNVAGNKKAAKRIQKEECGFVSSTGSEICLASPLYTERLAEFLCGFIRDNELSALELAFGESETEPCTDSTHNHGVGGKNDMYYLTAVFENRAELLRRLREANPSLHVTLCGMKNHSPFWRQWANAMDTAAIESEGGNALTDDMPEMEAGITQADTVYYDALCTHALQLPADALVLSPAVYSMSTDEFTKYTMWCTVRGEGVWNYTEQMLHAQDEKKTALANALQFKTENQHILQHCRFIGGRPADGNIYGFVSWTAEGDGVVAMRNPTDEKTSLTLTLNKLMGVPEEWENATCQNVYSLSVPQTDRRFGYGDKMDVTLHGYECVIFKFTKDAK